MIIHQRPSPNFDQRKTDVSYLVLHYTGMESGAAALERLCDKDAKVSAHYLVDEDGTLYQLVDENKRAWHAGVAEWAGQTDINSASIGVEIVNGGHNVTLQDGSLPPYTDMQINALIVLSKEIMLRQNIMPQNVLGHSDVAPARKIDPGEHFPWKGLAAAGIGLWPQKKDIDKRVLFDIDSRDRGIAIAQSGLAHIGYGARITGMMDETTVYIIQALQRRYRPEKIDGVIDMETMDIIKSLTEMYTA